MSRFTYNYCYCYYYYYVIAHKVLRGTLLSSVLVYEIFTVCYQLRNIYIFFCIGINKTSMLGLLAVFVICNFC